MALLQKPKQKVMSRMVLHASKSIPGIPVIFASCHTWYGNQHIANAIMRQGT